MLNGIEKLTKIAPVPLQVALKTGGSTEKFTFSRSWTPPRSILKHSTVLLALLDIKEFVTDVDVATKDLVIGLPVLRHFSVYTKALLEKRSDRLYGTDCVAVKLMSIGGTGGRVIRLMDARCSCISNDMVYENVE